MPVLSQHDFRTTALDSDLLSTSFGVQTNWHVITGAPSCGKTTLIDLLADKGFQTIPESARQYMEEEIATGRTIAEIRENVTALQRVLIDIQLGIEAGLQAKEVLFLDGAVPGSLAWYRLFGLDPDEILPECFHRRYASVFVLDRLPLQLDGLRFEADAHTGFLDAWIARDYSALGYRVVRVPMLAPEERLRFVLEKLSGQGLI
jgi:predicted ATPase